MVSFYTSICLRFVFLFVLVGFQGDRFHYWTYVRFVPVGEKANRRISGHQKGNQGNPAKGNPRETQATGSRNAKKKHKQKHDPTQQKKKETGKKRGEQKKTTTHTDPPPSPSLQASHEPLHSVQAAQKEGDAEAVALEKDAPPQGVHQSALVALLLCWFVALLVCCFVGLLVCWFVDVVFVFFCFPPLFCCFRLGCVCPDAPPTWLSRSVAPIIFLFPFFLGGCSTRNGPSPKKGSHSFFFFFFFFFFFSKVTEQLSWCTKLSLGIVRTPRFLR